ncbi:hypothetical protein D3C72_1650800 [compost metagenome]
MCICLVGVVPDVPFIKREVNFLLPAFFGLNKVCCGDYGMNKLVHPNRLSKEISRVLISISVILVKGDIIDMVISMLQNGSLPVRKSRHRKEGAAAGD